MEQLLTKAISESGLESIIDQLIEDATRNCREDRVIEHDGHFFATYLLAEFKATEAWPAVREAISLPDEKPFDLYEDAITEDFACIIAILAGNRSDVLDEMIADQSLNQFVRWAAIDAMLFCIDDGRLSREEAIRRIARHLRQAVDAQDELAEELVLRLQDLGAESELPLIAQAFAANLIDPQMATLDSVKQHIIKGDEIFTETMARLRYLDDVISRLSEWAAFEDEECIGSEWDDTYLDDAPLSSDGDYWPEATIFRTMKPRCGTKMRRSVVTRNAYAEVVRNSRSVADDLPVLVRRSTALSQRHATIPL